MNTENQNKAYLLLGRLRRRDYILCQLAIAVTAIAFITLNYLSFGFMGLVSWQETNWIVVVFILFEVYLTARRMQDCNLPAWLCLLLFIRILTVPLILFMCLNAGTKGTNKFGPDPREK